MADINEIADYIWKRARSYNVDPAMALGIAKSEGLNPKTIGSPTFGNKDARGYSYGPYQLYSGSSDPTKVAPGGMAHEFVQKYGEIPSASNWQQQVDFSLERMANKGVKDWYAVRDRGGVENITKIGEKYAGELGFTGQPAPAPAGVSPPWSNPVSALGDLDQRYLNGGLSFLASPITGLLGGGSPQPPPATPMPGQRMPDILAPVQGGDARLEPAGITPATAKELAGLSSLGNALMAAGAPKGPPPMLAGVSHRPKVKDDLFAGLFGYMG